MNKLTESIQTLVIIKFNIFSVFSDDSAYKEISLLNNNNNTMYMFL